MCDCAPTFTWNQTSLTCSCDPTTSVIIGDTCVDCSSIGNNNGINGDNSGCSCKAPYQWQWKSDSKTGECLCNTTFSIVPSAGVCLNCSTLSYVLGTASGNICDCAPTFTWNATSLTCSCDPLTSSIIGDTCVDCSSIENNSGVNHDNSECLCTSPYQWLWYGNNQTGFCLCNSTF
jgi:hypothetical protein